MNDNILNISSPNFWNNCYENSNTGWDLGSTTPIFVDWCDKLKNTNKKICVPGAGNGYDPLYFAYKGFNVTAIDFASSPIKHLQKNSKDNNLELDIIKKDIFSLGDDFNNQFDYIVEYTCYCAIDPKLRVDYINIMYDLLKRGGEFVGVFLPLNKDISEGGPPFGVDINETIDMFCNKFQLIESTQHHLSIEPRKDNEQFVRFIK